MKDLVRHDQERLVLTSPTAMPLASAFLWNPQMMLQVNCRGYATAQFMQPEPAKYAHAPNMEAKTFMQPEQAYYAHHPGRFFYVKDLESNELVSAPYEPVRKRPEHFEFVADQSQICWHCRFGDLELSISVSLAPNSVSELWEVSLSNLSSCDKRIRLVPYFPFGYMSWMNQSAHFDSDMNAVIAEYITPYQKVEDYFKQKDFKETSYLLCETRPEAWELRQSEFEGEGGLHQPQALSLGLSNSDAIYESPCAAVQYTMTLNASESETFRFAFGAVKDKQELVEFKRHVFTNFERLKQASKNYVAQAEDLISVNTPEKQLNNFVNHWLSRQIFYHGDVNRLSTDPQTRNYLQDNMGMAYLNANKARSAFLTALSQQLSSGAMPDGILLIPEAELKYINQVPHMDHCVWLPICLSAYLDETDDYSLLDQALAFADDASEASVIEHLTRAMDWLHTRRDQRGLNFIEQGDWNDPMNMVGYRGRGVSAWLTLAAAYANGLLADILANHGADSETIAKHRRMAEECNSAVNQHCWDKRWYARGITDAGSLFGVESDSEGKIFLNPQAFALLSGAASKQQTDKILEAVERHLETPYGVELLAPSYTSMREDIGRVTQKHPGSAENGSVYNHAAAFYIFALYQVGQADKATELLLKMLPDTESEDCMRRGQLPCFIPNYYRGAYRQFERTAGRSSQLFNTGTVHWFMRCLIDGLFGVQGCRAGLRLQPSLPRHWQTASIKRRFRGADFTIDYQRKPKASLTHISINNQELPGNIISDIETGHLYQVLIILPEHG